MCRAVGLCSPVVYSTALRVILQGFADDFMHVCVVEVTASLLCNLSVNCAWENSTVI